MADDYKTSCEIFIKRTEEYNGGLLWKQVEGEGKDPLVGLPVTVESVIQRLNVKIEEAKQMIISAKKVHGASAKKAAPGAKGRMDARSAEDRIEKIVIDYLKDKIRIHSRDKTTLVYTNLNGKLDLFKLGWEPTKTIQLKDFTGHMRKEDYSGWARLEKDVGDAIDRERLFFEEAGRVIPEFADILLRAIGKSLLSPPEGMAITGDLPIISWGGEALQKFPSDLLVPGPYTAFEQYLGRVSHPQELMAFIWKIFDPSDMGRQIMWGHSLGHAGQSCFWNAITAKLDRVTVVLQKTTHQDKHTLAECYLKRLALVPECNNPHFYSTEIVKQLSGNDQASVRPMYQSAISARLFCKIVALSNKSPIIDTTSKAMETRLLYFTTKPFPVKEEDPNIDARYAEEFWHFLYACREAHNELCSETASGGYGPIPMPKTMWDHICAACELPIRMSVRSFVSRRIRVSGGGEILFPNLLREFKTYYQDTTGGGVEASKLLGQYSEEVSLAFHNLIFDLLGSDPKSIFTNTDGIPGYRGVEILGDAGDEEELDI